MEEQSEKYLFEEMPVPKAVATLAIPTIISQVVTMIYNLADTFSLVRSEIRIWWRRYRWCLPGLICLPPLAICSAWAEAA